jgi:hypothetical protein
MELCDGGMRIPRLEWLAATTKHNAYMWGQKMAGRRRVGDVDMGKLSASRECLELVIDFLRSPPLSQRMWYLPAEGDR